ncbi:hypothetical protein F8M41_022731 [Gigaspora margarita]|uniref:Uncharacterized protein n=1 Tax=Gigaspora margarita TaxID=4874 RepID=A0A8H4AEL2_GIGMA|nr:hypothetical protein F8M41_022731 [Gigaspora margarita]
MKVKKKESELKRRKGFESDKQDETDTKKDNKVLILKTKPNPMNKKLEYDLENIEKKKKASGYCPEFIDIELVKESVNTSNISGMY